MTVIVGKLSVREKFYVLFLSNKIKCLLTLLCYVLSKCLQTTIKRLHGVCFWKPRDYQLPWCRNDEVYFISAITLT